MWCFGWGRRGDVFSFPSESYSSLLRSTGLSIFLHIQPSGAPAKSAVCVCEIAARKDLFDFKSVIGIPGFRLFRAAYREEIEENGIFWSVKFGMLHQYQAAAVPASGTIASTLVKYIQVFPIARIAVVLYNVEFHMLICLYRNFHTEALAGRFRNSLFLIHLLMPFLQFHAHCPA